MNCTISEVASFIAEVHSGPLVDNESLTTCKYSGIVLINKKYALCAPIVVCV